MTKSSFGRRGKVNGQPWIIGGDIVPPGSVYHLFTVQVLPIQCGGSLISPNYVLSAAHRNMRPSKLTTSVALRDPLDKTKDRILKVISILDHPNFKFLNCFVRSFDFTILKLEKPFNLFGFYPCLPNKNDQYVGDIVTTYGWGYTEVSLSKNRPLSDVLKFTTLTVISDTECAKILAEDGQPLAKGINIKAHMGVCADGRKNNTGICFGDSGGN
jgi:hypothetical protein